MIKGVLSQHASAASCNAGNCCNYPWNRLYLSEVLLDEIGLVTLVSTGLFVSPSNIKPCKTYAINRPPDKVVKAMQQGHSCWLETSYRINKVGDIIAYSGEWLCK